MRNTECSIRITTKRGRTWAYCRNEEGWIQTGPTGMVRRITAEQLLSHILPPLAAGVESPVRVIVKRITEQKTRVPKLRRL